MNCICLKKHILSSPSSLSEFSRKYFLLLMVFLRSRIKKRKSEIRDSAFFAKSVSALLCKNRKTSENEKRELQIFRFLVSCAISGFCGSAKYKGVWGFHHQADLYGIRAYKISACVLPRSSF